MWERLGLPSGPVQAVPCIEKQIGKEEFCDRFVASMVVRAQHATFADGCSVRDYARETALSYWDLVHFRPLGPELCVVSDMRHWHGPWKQVQD